jgi:hypothetical protein
MSVTAIACRYDDDGQSLSLFVLFARVNRNLIAKNLALDKMLLTDNSIINMNWSRTSYYKIRTVVESGHPVSVS